MKCLILWSNDRHLPERWGYIQFTDSTNPSESVSIEVKDPLWPTRVALAEMYQAETIYHALYGVLAGYSDDLNSLVLNARLPGWVARGDFTGVPHITLNRTDSTYVIDITVEGQQGLVGHIARDREMWFTQDDQRIRPNANNAPALRRHQNPLLSLRSQRK